MNSSKRPRWLHWVILVIAVVVAGVITAVGWRPLATSSGLIVPPAASTVPASLFSRSPSAGPDGSGAISPAPVPAGFRPASAQKVSAAVAAVGVPPEVSLVVRDLGSGAVLSADRGDDPVIPASSMKLMTTISLIDKVGPDTSYPTKVVSAPDGGIILVGGGDPMLGSTDAAFKYGSVLPPTLKQLADQTASALKAAGRTQVSLGYDDSLFTGPSRHPGWVPDDMQYVNDISALMVDEGAGSTTPSASAAQAFADQLGADGIAVTGTPSARTAGNSDTQLAAVSSLPLWQLVQQCLRRSDNTIAEVLFRHLAIAYGQPASFEGGASALHQAMVSLGLWRAGVVLNDGSGLDEADRLTTSALSQAIVLAASRDDLRNVLAALPVAAVNGTLQTRFLDAASFAGAGRVRAKTGSLDVSGALVGYTPTADGAMVAFAIVEHITDSDVRPYLDRLAAALSACPCSG
ncbi:D-alanyl-D-alanine carboxypeptidase / D-alanyl-D-alanine-endopeptidase (penicillin-binding protein 4) [Propionibacterium cyclohexanicum]|uniref:D-alanyl-D-alanine carboxypeptidase / D-alanyl-D-alanine-endopeptidase (Penicillin-binding protein 4) n=1 Tax=Propionibacterium cyclohexanicum TaxID=64702 RepID=A0A1H9RV33_9ACTN|nr:D-alanyl-D-alanine carboxypeptidase/D-alanyl-D-alanine-endopeptidase [Propionibacterium cyclohexanicum]SER76576.1 D-alanyl-D-alanine carboxypeptidase / D-alanyl-D-alanine-endopeptidase (penicillin-binding protein 4) [Propionibacterium cyclohexanicum]